MRLGKARHDAAVQIAGQIQRSCVTAMPTHNESICIIEQYLDEQGWRPPCEGPRCPSCDMPQGMHCDPGCERKCQVCKQLWHAWGIDGESPVAWDGEARSAEDAAEQASRVHGAAISWTVVPAIAQPVVIETVRRTVYQAKPSDDT